MPRLYIPVENWTLCIFKIKRFR